MFSTVVHVILSLRLKITVAIERVCKSRHTQEDYARVLFILELIIISVRRTFVQLLVMYVVFNIYSSFYFNFFLCTSCMILR